MFGFIFTVSSVKVPQLLSHQQLQVAAVFLFLQLLVASIKEPTRPSTIFGLFGGRLAAALTGNQIFYTLSLGFLGNACQGLTHKLSKEEATLPQLEKMNKKSPREVLGYQLSHMHYFPVLLLHSIWQSLTE